MSYAHTSRFTLGALCVGLRCEKRDSRLLHAGRDGCSNDEVFPDVAERVGFRWRLQQFVGGDAQRFPQPSLPRLADIRAVVLDLREILTRDTCALGQRELRQSGVPTALPDPSAYVIHVVHILSSIKSPRTGGQTELPPSGASSVVSEGKTSRRNGQAPDQGQNKPYDLFWHG
jgi:hypothetical protein